MTGSSCLQMKKRETLFYLQSPVKSREDAQFPHISGSSANERKGKVSKVSRVTQVTQWQLISARAIFQRHSHLPVFPFLAFALSFSFSLSLGSMLDMPDVTLCLTDGIISTCSLFNVSLVLSLLFFSLYPRRFFLSSPLFFALLMCVN